MSIWKKITAIVYLAGLIFSLNACVVTRDPGYHPPHMHSTFWWYYPDYQVYYHSVDHYYYYYDGGVWIRATTLPWRFALHDHRRVRIDIDGVPYARHSHHLRRYPPARSNHRNRDDDRHHRPDDNHRHSPGNDNRHRPSDDVKQGENIFRPHLKDKSYQDKRYPDKRDKFYDDSGRRVKEAEQKEPKKESSKLKDKGKQTYQKGKGKYKPQDSEQRNGKRSDDDEDESQDDRKPNKNQKMDKWMGR